MRGNYFTLSWYVTLVYTFAFALILLIVMSTPQHVKTPINFRYEPFQALPNGQSTPYTIETSIGKQDARKIIVQNFFKQYNAPLSDYAQEFINVADKYHLDYRLLPAISMQESNGGKIIPDGSYNPFGYGIYGNNIMKFDSFADAIDRVGRGLREDYLDQGLTTPYQIMTKYTPPSLEKGGPWAQGVETFMEELQ